MVFFEIRSRLSGPQIIWVLGELRCGVFAVIRAYQVGSSAVVRLPSSIGTGSSHLLRRVGSAAGATKLRLIWASRGEGFVGTEQNWDLGGDRVRSATTGSSRLLPMVGKMAGAGQVLFQILGSR